MSRDAVRRVLAGAVAAVLLLAGVTIALTPSRPVVEITGTADTAEVTISGFDDGPHAGVVELPFTAVLPDDAIGAVVVLGDGSGNVECRTSGADRNSHARGTGIMSGYSECWFDTTGDPS